ncbi:MAG: prepilin-type N-terminal cleavage/methylation domain-containing protein [Phycisphaerae bacterium]|nr:prepilin-type N-terminal cleavage/methylation domain-containing protein [Phycisphaerae bacterium]
MVDRFERSRGFSLLELLSAVAIIALLASILIPSLSSARKSAKQVVCASQLRALAQAAVGYSTDYNDAIPGSPLTSGAHFTQTPGFDVWKPGDSVVDWYDFAGAILPRLTATPTKDRKQLMARLPRKHFACPCNDETYGPYPQDQDYPVIEAFSYLTMNTFMRAGPGIYRQYLQRPPEGISIDEVWKVAWPDDYQVQMPDRYRPRFTRVGTSSLKVLLADGFRYYEPPATKDYCILQKAFAGNQSARPPCDVESREYGEMNAAQLSYRHGKDDTINAAFFDGHVASLKKNDSHKPEYYFPTGSIVHDESGFYTEWQRGNDIKLP